MNSTDKSSIYILILAGSIVMAPVAMVMYFILKAKAKKSLEEMYTLEQELENHYAHYLKKRSELEYHNQDVDRLTDKSSLYTYYELLDSVENSIFLIKEKMNMFNTKLMFVKNLFVLKVKDQILEKNVTKYEFNHDLELADIELTKKKIYKRFETL
jgi:hypothetical protein